MEKEIYLSDIMDFNLDIQTFLINFIEAMIRKLKESDSLHMLSFFNDLVKEIKGYNADEWVLNNAIKKEGIKTDSFLKEMHEKCKLILEKLGIPKNKAELISGKYLNLELKTTQDNKEEKELVKEIVIKNYKQG